MYSIVSNVTACQVVGAEYVNDSDRRRYLSCFVAVEKFVTDVGGAVGGWRAVDALMGVDSVGISGWTIDVYLDDTFNQARALADQIYAVGGEHAYTICVETKRAHRQFIIWVDARPLISVFALGQHKRVMVSSTLTTRLVPRIFGGEGTTRVLDSLVLAVGLCSLAYQPYSAKSSTTYTRLMECIGRFLRDDVAGVVEGGRGRSRGKRKRGGLIVDVVRDHGGVLVSNGSDRTAFISALEPEVFQRGFERAGWKCRFSKYDVGVVGDYQLIKYTFVSADDNIIADMYNSTTYECVPWTLRGGVKYAGLFVDLRFHLIEMYSLAVLGASLNKPGLLRRRDELRAECEVIWKTIETTVQRDPFEVFALTNIDGVHIEDNVRLKKISTDATLFTRYYPALKFESTVTADIVDPLLGGASVDSLFD